MEDTIYSLDSLCTPLELELTFYEKLFNFNKEGAKLVLLNILELGEKEMICLIPTEYIHKKGKSITIKSSIPVILYDDTPESIQLLRNQQKPTETILKCKVSISEAYTFLDESELKSNINIRKIIKPINYELMYKIYNSLISDGFEEKEIQSDEECIKLFLKSRGNKPIILMERLRKIIKAFPKSKYTKEIETHRFYISARYISIISTIN